MSIAISMTISMTIISIARLSKSLAIVSMVTIAISMTISMTIISIARLWILWSWIWSWIWLWTWIWSPWILWQEMLSPAMDIMVMDMVMDMAMDMDMVTM